MRKRQKFVLTTFLLLIGLMVFRSVPFDFKYFIAATLGLLTTILFAWSLKEGLNGIEWLTLLMLPVMFTVAFLLFTMLIPNDWLVGTLGFVIPSIIYDRIPKIVFEVAGRGLIYVLFGVSTYSLLLTENIYSVAAIRTIALLRAAHAIGFIVTVVTGFLSYYTVLTFRFSFWWVGLLVFGISFILLLPGIWSVNLEPKVSKQALIYSFWLAVLMAVLAMSVSFWPVGTAVLSLFLCTMFYVLLGITQHYFSQRLFAKTVWEYLTVGAVVLTTMLLTSGLGV
jgi:hypothetical protein